MKSARHAKESHARNRVKMSTARHALNLGSIETVRMKCGFLRILNSICQTSQNAGVQVAQLDRRNRGDGALYLPKKLN